jgi:hypothetical protein
MSEPSPPNAPQKRPDDSPNRGDVIALGLGCLVVVLFAIAMVIVAMSRE